MSCGLVGRADVSCIRCECDGSMGTSYGVHRDKVVDDVWCYDSVANVEFYRRCGNLCVATVGDDMAVVSGCSSESWCG